ncbi:MAG: InlB B-repeat-containing protein [Lachnospiraceae bacterium]|nr:InlB B-repeat-containing protein [Lachnospiraceae bacterium]
MKSEATIKARKKRFLAFLLVFILAVRVTPLSALALNISDVIDAKGQSVAEGETVKWTPQESYQIVKINYLDANGVSLRTITLSNVEAGVTASFNALYASELGLDEGSVNNWTVTDVEGSGNTLTDITLSANMSKKSNINYIFHGAETGDTVPGDAAHSNRTEYYEGKSEFDFDDATTAQEGYTFWGWGTSETFDPWSVKKGITTDDRGDKTVYGWFHLEDKYTITYHLPDGAVNDPANPGYYFRGEFDKVKINPATCYNREFVGWYAIIHFPEEDFRDPPQSDDPNTVQTLQGNEMWGGDVDVYGVFSDPIETEYDITYILPNGAVNDASNPKKYVASDGVASFKDASLEDYDFVGWFEDREYKKPVTSIAKGTTGDKTLYGKFTGKEYSIDYVLNGGANDIHNPQVYYFGEGVGLFKNAVKTGHDFGGWYEDPGFAENTRVTSISTTRKGNVTLYAKFTPAEYRITYVLNGGTPLGKNPEKYTFGVGVLSFFGAEKDKMIFDGWYSDSILTKKVESISADQVGDITLYAKFTEKPVITHKISYKLPKGSVNPAANPDKYEEGVGVESFADASKDGCTFIGWYRDKDFTEPITGISVQDTVDFTLYGKFDPNTYSITYDLDGGVNDPENPTSYTFGQGASLKPATKEGMYFKGWYAEAFTTAKYTDLAPTGASMKKITKIPANAYGDVTVTAVFSKTKGGGGGGGNGGGGSDDPGNNPGNNSGGGGSQGSYRSAPASGQFLASAAGNSKDSVPKTGEEGRDLNWYMMIILLVSGVGMFATRKKPEYGEFKN